MNPYLAKCFIIEKEILSRVIYFGWFLLCFQLFQQENSICAMDN